MITHKPWYETRALAEVRWRGSRVPGQFYFEVPYYHLPTSDTRGHPHLHGTKDKPYIQAFNSCRPPSPPPNQTAQSTSETTKTLANWND